MPQIAGELFSSAIVAPKENIVDEIFALAPFSTPFLQEIGMGPNGPLNTLKRACTNAVYSWPETALTSNRTTLAVALAGAATSMTLTNANTLRAGDRVLIDRELIDITTVAAGQPTVIVRAVGGTADVAHLILAVVVNTGAAKVQGTGLGTAVSDQPALVTNHTQIWVEDVDVSGTALAVEAYGRAAGDYAEQQTQIMRKIKEQLEHAVLFGGTAVAAATGATAGRMKGGLGFITTNVTDVLAARLDYEDITKAMESCYNAGGMPDTIICGSFNKRTISGWKMGSVRYNEPGAAVAQPSSAFGAVVGFLDTDFGTVKVMSKHSFPQSLVMIVTKPNVGVGPLVGNGEDRSFAHFEVAKEGDRKKGLIIGEYTCEWRLEKSHALIVNTATS
jgi:hypothetical protein